MKYYSEADFDLVLRDPPSGVFDRRSVELLEPTLPP
jgi:hypothetical protein